MFLKLKLQLFADKDIAKRAINGTFGSCYLEGEYVAETTGLKADVGLNYMDVPICGSLEPGKKLSGTTRNGNITMHKINSRMARLLSDNIKAGKTPSFTIVSNLDDPDAYGAERVVLTGVKFTNLTLIDWTVGQLGSINQSFTFDDWEYMDTIDEA